MNRSKRSQLQTSLAFAVVLGTSLGLERQAHALQGGEDPSKLPVLIDKRFGADGRHQLGLQFSTAIATKFVEATGFYLTYDYNFMDMLGLEVGGGYFFGKESKIMAQVRENFPNTEPPLSDLYQLQWMGTAALIFTPFYGKMSIAGIFDPSWDLFLVVGGGAVGTRRQLGKKDEVPEPANVCPGGEDFCFDSQVTGLFTAGAGMRLYFLDYLILRLEMRNYLFPEPAQGKGGATSGLHVQAGLQFNFGGGS